MRRGTTTVCAVAVAALVACGGGKGSGDPDAGGGGGPDASWDDIIELTLEEDGAERGSGMTGPDGMVRFYSAEHDALFELGMGDADEAMLAGVEVHVEVRDDGATYWVEDPSGRYMPMLFGSEIPTALGQQLTVDGKDLIEQGGDVFEFDPEQGDPYANLIVGFSVSISISGVMRGLGQAAALLVLKELVEETCLFFAPLHDDVCGVVASVVDFAGSVGVAGVKLVVKKGLSWTAGLAQATWSEAWSELRKKGCEAGSKALVSWFVPAPEGEKAVQQRYRLAAYKYRYALKKLDEMPPADATARAAAIADLELAGQALAMVGGKVRDHYYEIYNDDQSQFLTDASFKGAGVAIKKLVEVRPLILESLTIAYGYEQLLTVTSTTVDIEAYEFIYGEAVVSEGEPVETPWAAEWGLDCGLAAAKTAYVTWTENSSQQQAELDIETAVGYMIDIIEEFVDDVHAEHWGGGVPDPDCLPDIWEPNETWQSALAAPFAGYLGGGSTVVEVDNLNLCDGQTAAEEDWFAFDAAPINFNVQARIRKSSGGSSGENERICLELYWYSQAYEIGMFPPSVIEGPVCGTVASEFSTGQVNVGQVTGETYRYVLARVYPDPGVATPALGIDYKLTFTP